MSEKQYATTLEEVLALRSENAALLKQLVKAMESPEALMAVVNARINDYVELHNRGDLTDYGDHAWLAMVNLRRDMEFALSKLSQTDDLQKD